MKMMKVLSGFALIGSRIVERFARTAESLDRLIHRRENERRARRARRFWTVLLSVAGGLLAILLFPYKIVIRRNGDFEVRTLLVRCYRKTAEYDIPEGGSDSFDIEGVEEEAEDGDLIAGSDGTAPEA